MSKDITQIIVSAHGTLPVYSSEYAAGADLRAYIDVPVVLQPGDRYLMPTNTYLSIPKGYEGQVRPRSGLAIKHGITLINTPGTIDSDYRGELKVPMINLGKKSYSVSPQERIAQLVISPCVRAQFIHVEKESLSKTQRGKGGFGSTGVE